MYIESPHIPNIFAASVSSESKRLTNLLRSLLFGDVSESSDVSSLVSRTLLLFRRFLQNAKNSILVSFHIVKVSF